MSDAEDHNDLIIRIVVVVTLGIVLIFAIIGLTVVAVATDRNLARPETFTFGGVILLTGLGGVSWWSLRRRRRWSVQVQRGNGGDGEPGQPHS